MIPLRVKKESNYNAAGALLKETSYSYDASGKRLVQSSVDNTRTFNYTAGYQLDTVTETSEIENYDYDQNGRLTLIQRDGKTLDLEHDSYQERQRAEGRRQKGFIPSPECPNHLRDRREQGFKTPTKLKIWWTSFRRG